MKFTKEQQEAIETRDKNILVAAAAGSGKTAVLIERLRKIIVEEKTSVKKLLVLTFTKAAANEMRSRLSLALLNTLKSKEDNKEYIYQQINALEESSISTLHRFCLNVLREYYQHINIDPNFRVGDAAELAMLRTEALEELFETAYEDSLSEKDTRHFKELIEQYTSNRDDMDLKNLVENLHDFLMTQPEPDAFCQSAINQFDLTSFNTSIWEKQLIENVEIELNGSESLIKKAFEYLNYETKMGTNGFEKMRICLENDLERIKTLKESISLNGYEDFQIELATTKPFDRFSGNKEAKESSDLIKKYRDLSKKSVQTLASKYELPLETAIKDIKNMKASMVSLIGLTHEFEALFWQKKVEKNIIDFHDMEQLTLELLKIENVRDELRDRYRYIYIDEYQDSNAVQETIIRSIARVDNLFFVGDVKQSIYRFRMADPTIFIKTYDHYQKNKDNLNKLITLGQNFRSAEGVINSINALFENIMCKAVGEVQYNQDAKLYKGLPYTGKYEKTEIQILDADKIVQEGMDQTELEARYIAEQINKIIGTTRENTRGEELKKIKYGDIAVLMRNVSNRGDVFAKVFTEMGIPCLYDGGDYYYDAIEVRIVTNLMAIIDNPKNDIALLSIMASPIGSFNTEEIAKIRLLNSNENIPFYYCAEKYKETQEDELSAKLKIFYEKIEEWYEVSTYLPIDEYINYLYDETGYYDFVGALIGGEQRQLNLRSLLQRANDFKKTRLQGIYSFIRFIETIKKQHFDTESSVKTENAENVVKIMSIHKSKGLEFPIVFLTGVGKKFNVRDTYDKVLFHNELGICPDFIDLKNRCIRTTLAKEICAYRMRIETLSEEMRLLYVAMSRSEEKLFIVGFQRGLQKAQEKWMQPLTPYRLQKAETPLEWIMSAISTINMEDSFKVSFVSEWEPTSVNINSKGECIVSDNLNVDKKTKLNDILQRLEQTSCIESEKIPEKISVTAAVQMMLAKNNNPLSVPEMIEKPKFMIMDKEETISGAEWGSVMHSMLEHLDLKTMNNSIETQTKHLEQIQKKLIEKAIVPHEIAKKINCALLLKFFNSEIGKRLLKSKHVIREKTFNYVYEGSDINPNWTKKIMIQGMIDCAFIENSKWILLDFKTDKSKSENEIKAVISKYAPQLNLYAKALSSLSGIPVNEKHLCLLSSSENIRM